MTLLFYVFQSLAFAQTPIYYVGTQDQTTLECFVETSQVAQDVLQVRASVVDQHDGAREIVGPVDAKYIPARDLFIFEDRAPQAPIKSLIFQFLNDSGKMGVEVWHGDHHHPTWCSSLSIAEGAELVEAQNAFSETEDVDAGHDDHEHEEHGHDHDHGHGHGHEH